jgi:hypothetical protein
MRIALLFFTLALSPLAHAGMEFRVLGNVHEIKAAEINSFYANQQLKEIHRLPGLKLDVAFNPLSRVFFGLRFSNSRLHLGDGTGPITGDTNFSKLIFESYGIFTRIYLIESKILRFDIFGGAGGARAMVSSKKTLVEQSQGIRDNDLRFMQFAGGSLSLGYEKFMVLFEGGYEWARINGLSYYSSNASPRLTMLDLNGPYVGLGVVFRYK